MMSQGRKALFLRQPAPWTRTLKQQLIRPHLLGEPLHERPRRILSADVPG